MAENINRKISRNVGGEAVEFPLSNVEAISSPVRKREIVEKSAAVAPAADKTTETGLEAEKRTPEFLQLAAPELPKLSKNNRARLLMQSPNRVYFYWSIGKNPFRTLNRVVGASGGYSLVLKLINLQTEDEMIHAVDSAGSFWFDVDANAEYRAEIGFYAVNRPYIRVLYSNTVVTPRKNPSPRPADSARWTVTADKFARVLDVAGFARDAFDIALAGDDWNAAEIATRSAFAQFSGLPHTEFIGIGPDEIRYALLALASGVRLENLRSLISERLFAILSGIPAITGERALSALKDKFEFDADDFEIEEPSTEAVFGASLVNFPRKVRRIPKLEPPGSHTLLR